MSLRFRLIGLVCVVLLISLALGGAIAYCNASRSVRAELRAAMLVGRQTIENAIERLPDSRDPSRDLDALVASFNGNRHLRVRLGGKAPALAAPAVERARFGGPPGWFVGLFGVAPETERIRVAAGGRSYGTIVLETDPYNETLEVWGQFTDTLVTLAVFCGLTILLIYLVIGRALRPLDRLVAALEEIGDGRYRTRISGRLAPELARLRDGFNRMAARLAETDGENRRLNEQLLTLQEAERGELARDLHDEVSPYLFAISADAATASRFLAEARSNEAAERILSISEAVRYMQHQVRRMLDRLRPVGLAEFGLREAIEYLVAFWRRRCPEILYEVMIAPECADLEGLAGTAACRIVQEALSNAVRHAGATRVKIAVEPNCEAEGHGAVKVTVIDDGRGAREPIRLGYGLVGIRERVNAIGGQLRFSTGSGRGFMVVAVLPTARDPVSPRVEAATL
jgi:two-component system sensor histidine kinase UhpB